MNRYTPFVWIAAIRFLREGRMQTLFIVTGVAIGVGVIIFMSAMLTGMQANFIRRVLTSQAHIVLIPPDQVSRPLREGEANTRELATVQRPTQRIQPIDQWQKIRVEMARWPGITAVAPIAAGSALAIRGDAGRSITIAGIEPDLYFPIVNLPANIVQGEARVTSEDIVIGTELAKDLGVGVGDKIRVSAASGQALTLTITGLFDLGSKGVNQRNTFVLLRTAQSLLGLIGGATEIDLTVDDIYAAQTIAEGIERTFPVEADSWIKTNAQFFTAVQAQILANTSIRFFVALSVAFGIASVLVVSVIQRSKEIGILRAMGTSRRQILLVFLTQGGVLGFVGALFGSMLGGASLVLFHDYARQADGSELFPLILDQSLFTFAILLATAVGLAAAMTPALRAARLDPVVAIRG